MFVLKQYNLRTQRHILTRKTCDETETGTYICMILGNQIKRL